jgi:hypothetical protein
MGKHRLHPSVGWDLRGTGLYTTLHPHWDEYMASTYRTRENVCSVTTWSPATELWQWTRQRIASVQRTDHRLCAPKWLVLPDVTTWPKTDGMRVLSSCMTRWHYFGLLARKLTRNRKKTTSLAIIWRNAYMYIISCTHFFLWLLRKEGPVLQYALYTVNMERCQPLSVQMNAVCCYWVDRNFYCFTVLHLDTIKSFIYPTKCTTRMP